MKKSVLLLAPFIFIACVVCRPRQVENTCPPQWKDSMVILNGKIDSLTMLTVNYEKNLLDCKEQNNARSDSINFLQDSIGKLLQRPMMTEQQFLDLYRYERIKKYFDLCEKDASQWKYMKGWLRRIMENK